MHSGVIAIAEKMAERRVTPGKVVKVVSLDNSMYPIYYFSYLFTISLEVPIGSIPKHCIGITTIESDGCKHGGWMELISAVHGNGKWAKIFSLTC